MVHIPLCFNHKKNSFQSKGNSFFDVVDSIEVTPEKEKKKKKIESPMVTQSVVEDFDPSCFISKSHPSHKNGKIKNPTQASIIMRFGKDEIKLCCFGHLEGNSKDLVKKEMEKHKNFISKVKDGKPQHECRYKTCKMSDEEGVRITGGEINVSSLSDPNIIVYFYCCSECMFKSMTGMSKSTFTNEFGKKSKQLALNKKKQIESRTTIF